MVTCSCLYSTSTVLQVNWELEEETLKHLDFIGEHDITQLL